MMGGGDLVIKGAARKESGIAEIAAAKANKEAKKHGESSHTAAHDGNKAAGAGILHSHSLISASANTNSMLRTSPIRSAVDSNA
jgi:hypothetical protein